LHALDEADATGGETQAKFQEVFHLFALVTPTNRILRKRLEFRLDPRDVFVEVHTHLFHHGDDDDHLAQSLLVLFVENAAGFHAFLHRTLLDFENTRRLVETFVDALTVDIHVLDERAGRVHELLEEVREVVHCLLELRILRVPLATEVAHVFAHLLGNAFHLWNTHFALGGGDAVYGCVDPVHGGVAEAVENGLVLFDGQERGKGLVAHLGLLTFGKPSHARQRFEVGRIHLLDFAVVLTFRGAFVGTSDGAEVDYFLLGQCGHLFSFFSIAIGSGWMRLASSL